MKYPAGTTRSSEGKRFNDGKRNKNMLVFAGRAQSACAPPPSLTKRFLPRAVPPWRAPHGGLAPNTPPAGGLSCVGSAAGRRVALAGPQQFVVGQERRRLQSQGVVRVFRQRRKLGVQFQQVFVAIIFVRCFAWRRCTRRNLRRALPHPHEELRRTVQIARARALRHSPRHVASIADRRFAIASKASAQFVRSKPGASSSRFRAAISQVLKFSLVRPGRFPPVPSSRRGDADKRSSACANARRDGRSRRATKIGCWRVAQRIFRCRPRRNGPPS